MTLLVGVLTVVALSEAGVIALGLRSLLNIKKRLTAMVAAIPPPKPPVEMPEEAMRVVKDIFDSDGKLSKNPWPEGPGLFKSFPLSANGSPLEKSDAETASRDSYSTENATLHSRLQADPKFVRALKRLQKKHAVHTKTYQAKIHPLVRRHAKRLGLDVTGTSAELPKPGRAG